MNAVFIAAIMAIGVHIYMLIIRSWWLVNILISITNILTVLIYILL